MKVAIADIERFASEVTAIPVAEIRGRRRQRIFIRPRMLIAHFARHEGHSFARIGRAMGGRDHSTIINLFRRSEDCRGRDRLFDRMMNRMEAAMKAGQVAIPMVPVKFSTIEPLVTKRPERIEVPDRVDLADYHNRKAMRMGSEKLLAALRAAA